MEYKGGKESVLGEEGVGSSEDPESENWQEPGGGTGPEEEFSTGPEDWSGDNWTGLYWYSTITSEGTWVQHFDDSDWENGVADPRFSIVWDTDHWENGAENIRRGRIDSIGSWFVDYRPVQIRVTFTGNISLIELRAADGENTFASKTSPSSPQTIACDFTPYETDIGMVWLFFTGDITITNIEFYETVVSKFTGIVLGDWYKNLYPSEIKVRYDPPIGNGSTSLKLIDEAANNIVNISNYTSDTWTKIQWVGKNQIYKIELTPDTAGELVVYEMSFKM